MIDPATPIKLRRDARLSRRNGGILASPPLLDTAADEIDQLRNAVKSLVLHHAASLKSISWYSQPSNWDDQYRKDFDDAAALIGFDPFSPELEKQP